MADIFSPLFFLKTLAIFIAISRQSQAGRSLKRQMNFRKVRDRGDSLAPEDIISSHTVHSKLECSLKCLQKQTCVGYNYKPKSNKYAENCQISNKTQEKDRESVGSEEWTFYQELKTLTTENEKYQESERNVISTTLKPLKQCPDPTALGMQSGKITDNAITASSFYDGNHKPSYGRLNTHLGFCAWASTLQGKNNSWFQVDLGQLTIVTGIATQGKCQYTYYEWAKSYSISYSTDDVNWAYYKESGYVKTFQANGDQNSIVTHTFKSPIHAWYVRVWPQSWYAWAAMRVEYYGCRQ